MKVKGESLENLSQLSISVQTLTFSSTSTLFFLDSLLSFITSLERTSAPLLPCFHHCMHSCIAGHYSLIYCRMSLAEVLLTNIRLTAPKLDGVDTRVFFENIFENVLKNFRQFFDNVSKKIRITKILEKFSKNSIFLLSSLTDINPLL